MATAKNPVDTHPAQKVKSELLLEAEDLVTKQRGQLYGDPLSDFSRTAGMWTSMFAHMLQPGQEFKPHHVAQAMACLKLSRTAYSPQHRDSWVDLAGYAACGWACVDGELKEPEEVTP